MPLASVSRIPEVPAQLKRKLRQAFHKPSPFLSFLRMRTISPFTMRLEPFTYRIWRA